MPDPNAHKPPTTDPIEYAAEHAKRAASALYAIPPVLLNEHERLRYAHLADQLVAIAEALRPC